jgi:hypothetical protein
MIFKLLLHSLLFLCSYGAMRDRDRDTALENIPIEEPDLIKAIESYVYTIHLFKNNPHQFPQTISPVDPNCDSQLSRAFSWFHETARSYLSDTLDASVICNYSLRIRLLYLTNDTFVPHIDSSFLYLEAVFEGIPCKAAYFFTQDRLNYLFDYGRDDFVCLPLPTIHDTKSFWTENLGSFVLYHKYDILDDNRRYYSALFYVPSKTPSALQSNAT